MRCSSSTRSAACAASLALLACGTLSVGEEQQLGQSFEQQMRGELVFVNDETIHRYVREIGQAMVRASGPHPFAYTFEVVRDDAINAFAGPAGHIYVHTQTILKARDVSELAGVLAHEVGHVALRHIARNYNRQRNTSIGRQLLVVGAAVVGGGGAAQAASLGTGLAAMAYLNTFGREAEMEADQFAVTTLVRAGYAPEGLVTFFETLQRESGGREPPAFLSSHPATGERIRATRAAITALDAPAGLRKSDGGKLEIVQRRIELLAGR